MIKYDMQVDEAMREKKTNLYGHLHEILMIRFQRHVLRNLTERQPSGTFAADFVNDTNWSQEDDFDGSKPVVSQSD
jgi:hypothetical protein